MAFIQATLRSQNSDSYAGEKSFRYGRSTSNQVFVCEMMCAIVDSFNAEN